MVLPPKGRAVLAGLSLVLASCEVLEDLPDGGPDDAATTNDGGPTSNCPGSEDFVGDPSWPYTFTVDPSAVFCGLVTEQPLRDAPAKAFRIHLTPGTYRLPETPGTYQMRLPFCAEGATSIDFELEPAGPLTLDTVPLGEDAFWLYRLEQGFSIGGAAAVLDIGIDVLFQPSIGEPPELILDDERDHGAGPDTSVTYLSCGDPCGEPVWFEPCPTPGEGQLYAVRFDRGRVEMNVRVYPSFGPSGPAALTEARGELDGTSFTQSDFFKLAHRPDHHNHGGGFFVSFDAPIGDVCGIELEVPSRDGGWATLGGRLVDCDSQTIEEMSGLVLEGG